MIIISEPHYGTSSPKGNDRSPENKQVFSNNSQASKIFSIGQGQPTLQSMVGQSSDVNKGRNSVASLKEPMMGVRPRQRNRRQVFRSFKSHPRLCRG